MFCKKINQHFALLNDPEKKGVMCIFLEAFSLSPSVLFLIGTLRKFHSLIGQNPPTPIVQLHPPAPLAPIPLSPLPSAVPPPPSITREVCPAISTPTHSLLLSGGIWKMEFSAYYSTKRISWSTTSNLLRSGLSVNCVTHHMVLPYHHCR